MCSLTGYNEIKISNLYVDSSNIRTEYEVNGDDENTIDDLSESIKTQGLMTPLSVRPDGEGRYKIYAGSRRFKAIQKLGWETIPCFVSELNDDEAKIKSLVENFMRQGNSYREKTKAFNELYNNSEKDLKKVENITGFKQDTLKRYIKLSRLPDSVLDKLDTRKGEKRLTMEVAEQLCNFPSDISEKVANIFVSKQISSKDMKSFVRKMKEDNVDISNPKEVDTIITTICFENAKESGILTCDCSHFNLDDGTRIDIDAEYIPILYKYYKKIIA